MNIFKILFLVIILSTIFSCRKKKDIQNITCISHGIDFDVTSGLNVNAIAFNNEEIVLISSDESNIQIESYDSKGGSNWIENLTNEFGIIKSFLAVGSGYVFTGYKSDWDTLSVLAQGGMVQVSYGPLENSDGCIKGYNFESKELYDINNSSESVIVFVNEKGQIINKDSKLGELATTGNNVAVNKENEIAFLSIISSGENYYSFEAGSALYQTLVDSKLNIALYSGTGTLHWETNIENIPTSNGHIYEASVEILDDKVVVISDYELFELDKNSGEILYRGSPGDDIGCRMHYTNMFKNNEGESIYMGASHFEEHIYSKGSQWIHVPYFSLYDNYQLSLLNEDLGYFEKGLALQDGFATTNGGKSIYVYDKSGRLLSELDVKSSLTYVEDITRVCEEGLLALYYDNLNNKYRVKSW